MDTLSVDRYESILVPKMKFKTNRDETFPVVASYKKPKNRECPYARFRKPLRGRPRSTDNAVSWLEKQLENSIGLADEGYLDKERRIFRVFGAYVKHREHTRHRYQNSIIVKYAMWKSLNRCDREKVPKLSELSQLKQNFNSMCHQQGVSRLYLCTLCSKDEEKTWSRGREDDGMWMGHLKMFVSSDLHKLHVLCSHPEEKGKVMDYMYYKLPESTKITDQGRKNHGPRWLKDETSLLTTPLANRQASSMPKLYSSNCLKPYTLPPSSLPASPTPSSSIASLLLAAQHVSSSSSSAIPTNSRDREELNCGYALLMLASSNL